MKPREYQLQAIENIKQSFKKGNKNICIALCGGSGKSLVAKLILDMAKEKGSKKIHKTSHCILMFSMYLCYLKVLV